MKKTASFLIAIIFTLTAFFTVNAQSAETIWLSSSDTLVYKTGEIVAVTVNASSSSPVQGFTFQIRYDPACVEPIDATSPISGMNGVPSSQTSGLVDAAFASDAPQTVDGILAEVRFVTLGECLSSLTLENATLTDGFAAPLAGVTVGERHAVVTIDREVGTSNLPDPASGGTSLPLGSAIPPTGEFPSWLIILFSLLAGVMGVLVALNLLRRP